MNPNTSSPRSPLILFQSLKGFQRLWIKRIVSPMPENSKFQSLKGFQRLWIFAGSVNFVTFTLVSIPKRVSEALNLCCLDGCRCPSFVSIPKRVSEALNLQRSRLQVVMKRPYQFQSLKGFQRLWILIQPNDYAPLLIVSIPKRVSEALNRRFFCRFSWR